MTTANMQAMQDAAKLISKMIAYVELYEAGEVEAATDFTVELSSNQITSLKAAFATARTECKALLDTVSAA